MGGVDGEESEAARRGRRRRSAGMRACIPTHWTALLESFVDLPSEGLRTAGAENLVCAKPGSLQQEELLICLQ